jgi:hypothetical protein
MANELAKYLNSRRRQKDENAVRKQAKIAKQRNSIGAYQSKAEKQPHRFSKHHAMDCGNPKCYLCGNPRKTHKDKLTAQEKRLYQDLEQTTDRHSNGLKNGQEDDFL